MNYSSISLGPTSTGGPLAAETEKPGGIVSPDLSTNRVAFENSLIEWICNGEANKDHYDAKDLIMSCFDGAPTDPTADSGKRLELYGHNFKSLPDATARHYLKSNISDRVRLQL
jgi:hypothetical protein